MLIRAVHIENWRCLGRLDLDDLPDGIIVLHGPNGTGKTSLVKALRGCLFDFEHDSNKAELKKCVPWNSDRSPKVVVEFETGGSRYRLAKVFSRKTDGMARLEKLHAGQWLLETESPREASRRVRELLGADKSTAGLNQLLWVDQGTIDLPGPRDLDASLEKQLVHVLGLLVTGQDLAFKQALDKRCEQWFTERTGGQKKNTTLSRLEQQRLERLKVLEEEEKQYREMEQALRDTESCEARLPELQRAVAEAKEEVERLEAERERSRARRQHYEDACRQLQESEQRLQEARKHAQALEEAGQRCRQAAEASSLAEGSLNAAVAEKDRLHAVYSELAHRLQLARNAEEAQQRGREEIDDRGRLLRLAEQQARLEKMLTQAQTLRDACLELERKIPELAAPDGPTLEKLRGNRREAAKMRAQLQAEALSLSLTLQRPEALAVRVDAEPSRHEQLAAGEKRTWLLHQCAIIDLDGLGTVEVARSASNVDSARAARRCADLDREFDEVVRSFQEQSDDEACLDRLSERRLHKEAAIRQLTEVRQQLQQQAPHGSAALQSEYEQCHSQRLLVLERRPELTHWQPLAGDVSERERAFQAQALALRHERTRLEEATVLARKDLDAAENTAQFCKERTLEARTAARYAGEERQRLGDDTALAALRSRAEEAVQQASRHVAEAELTEQEKTIDQRSVAAGEALAQRETRLQELKDERNRWRGYLQSCEGLHTRRAEASAALTEVEDALRREKLEAAAHRRLRDLFEQSRDGQVQQVMGPIGERVLDWARDLGLDAYQEVSFGERYLPEGILRQGGNPDSLVALDEESYGTGEQLNLLVRVALGGVLARDEPLAAILDDPLAHADPIKHRRILDILRRAARGNPAWVPAAGPLQIIILTCHPERFDHLDGARHINLASLIRRAPV